MENLQSKDIPTVTIDDLPALFVTSDKASNVAQSNFLRIVKADLILLFLGGVSTSWSIHLEVGRVVLASIGAVLLGIGILLTVFLRTTEYDKVWYGARAIAESVKTITWRYMTCAEPYNSTISVKEADSILCREIAMILNDHRSLGHVLGGVDASAEQITNQMRNVRSLSFEERKKVYFQDRLKDQQVWYAKKSESNEKSARNWFVAVIISQALALISAILLISFPNLDFNFASVFSSLAVVFIAWLQTKRYQDLANSYGVAAHEIGIILAKGRHIKDDNSLSEFVSDSENAISREHTFWVARRDTL